MRLLVIEDDPRLLNVIVREFTEEGYAVNGVSDGNEGLFEAQHTSYDAIILDVMLPGIDGWEILRRIREDKSTTPVLMLTSKDLTTDRVRGLDLGADDYLTKPFELDELFARVRSIIRRASSMASSIVEIGDIAVDLSARRVSKSGQPVELTAREYTLVEALAYRKGRVVEKAFLTEQLSDDFNEVNLSNMVEVHLCNVRKKLGKDFVRTVRGLGYIVEAQS